MKRLLFLMTIYFSLSSAYGQTKRVLFLGNSYTYANNLPQLVYDVAAAMGDTIFFDSNAMGGATLYAHLLNTVSQDKIKSGHWDFVLLQGQSLELWGNFPDILESFPEAGALDSIINHHSSCAETVFYRTWGRKNGFGTYSYETMDSMIHMSYMKLSDSLDAVLSPVGEVWKFIRHHYPSIELYDPDESHPSLAGSYTAACCFYTVLFRKDPTLITFNPGLPGLDAENIRYAAKVVVYNDMLKWHIGEYDSLFSNAGCILPQPSPVNPTANSFFPNPFSTRATLQTVADLKDATLTVYNLLGQSVRRIYPVSGNTVTVFRDDLSNGPYFIRLTQDNRVMLTVKAVISD